MLLTFLLLVRSTRGTQRTQPTQPVAEGSTYHPLGGWNGLGRGPHTNFLVNFVSSDVTSVAAGTGHSIVLNQDGSVCAAGDNMFGQLGDGSNFARNIFVKVINSGAKAVSAGEQYSLVVKQDGSLWATGNNEFGQFGGGAVTESRSFIKVVSMDVKAVAAAASGKHSMMVKQDGSLWATGSNDRGQLGDGSTTDRQSFVKVVSSGAKAVAADWGHSILIKEDGSLWATGYNRYGQLGDGSATDRHSFVKVVSSGAKAVATGFLHSMLIKQDGSLWATGLNGKGQLGDPWSNNLLTFGNVIPGGVEAVDAGVEHSIVLKQDGSMWVTSESYGQFITAVPNGVKAVAAGKDYTILAKQDGTVWATAIIPVSVSRFDHRNDFEGWDCGKITTCGKYGHICGGYNVKGAGSDITKTFNLPAGTYSVELDFIKIDSWDHEDAYVSVNGKRCWSMARLLGTTGTQQCGGVHYSEDSFRVTGCYATLSGVEANMPLTVRVWTSLDGDPSDESFSIDNVVIEKAIIPVSVSRFDHRNDFEGWDCGKITTCGKYGHICGGYNVKGAGSDITKTFNLPAGTYSVELDFIKIDSWDHEDAYVSVNGKRCWSMARLLGTTGTQQCGGVHYSEDSFRVTGCYATLSGVEANMPLAVRVWTSLDGDPSDESFSIDNVVIEKGMAPALAVAAGDGHSLVLKQDGSLWVAGDNRDGQLGDGSTLRRKTFVKVLFSGVKAVAAGAHHSMVLKEDGSVWATGQNDYGKLGEDRSTERRYFVRTIQSDAKAVTAGRFHSMVLKQDGSVWVAGRTFFDPKYIYSDGFVQVVKNGVEAMAAGKSHSMILKQDGSVWTQGYNSLGQLGDGSITNREKFKKVISSGAKAVAAGDQHSMVLKQDGSLWAAGQNWHGQFGDGTKASWPSFKQVVSSGVQAVAARDLYSLIVKQDGSLWGAGKGPYDQLGDGSRSDTSFVQVISSGVKAVGAGWYHTMVLKQDDSVWVAGQNDHGQFGDGSTTDRRESIFVQVTREPQPSSGPTTPTTTAVKTTTTTMAKTDPTTNAKTTTGAVETASTTSTTTAVKTTTAMTTMEKGATPQSSGCPTCGTFKSGQLSCCAPGGAWFKRCYDPAEIINNLGHSWLNGVDACKMGKKQTTTTSTTVSTPAISPVCPKCGTTKKSGKLSCCARGGAWFNKCGDVGDPKFEHTWLDGIRTCKSSNPTSAARTIASPAAVSPTCPKCGIKKSGKLSCCALGGDWFRQCGDAGDPTFEHTWLDGIQACKTRAQPLIATISQGPTTTRARAIGPACPKCGTTKKSGKRSCCARGGAWFNKCGDVGDPKFEHTWLDGIRTCENIKSANEAASTTSLPTIGPVCPKCGILKKSGRLSCCAPGGVWFKKCGNPGELKFDHTWFDGIQSCKRTEPATPMTTSAGAIGPVCLKCGVIKKSGKLSCCAPGGTWFKRCGNPGDEHTWKEGIQVCKALAGSAQERAVLETTHAQQNAVHEQSDPGKNYQDSESAMGVSDVGVADSKHCRREISKVVVSLILLLFTFHL